MKLSFLFFILVGLSLSVKMANASSISADGTKLLIEKQGGGYTCVTSVYDLINGSNILSFFAHSYKGCGDHPSFSPDGRYVAVNDDKIAIVYDLKMKSVVFREYKESGYLRFSPDGKYLAIGSGKFITTYDYRAGKYIHTIMLENDEVEDFHFTSNDTIFVRLKFGFTVYGTRPFQAFSTFTGDRTNIFHFDSIYPWLSGDGKYICTFDSIYDASTGNRYPTPLRGNIFSQFSNNSKFVATRLDSNKAVVLVRKWPEYSEVNRISLEGLGLSSTAVSNDGTVLIGYGTNATTAWDLKSGAEKWRLPKNSDMAVFSPDSLTLVTENSQGIDVWDVQSGVLKFSIK